MRMVHCPDLQLLELADKAWVRLCVHVCMMTGVCVCQIEHTHRRAWRPLASCCRFSELEDLRRALLKRGHRLPLSWGSVPRAPPGRKAAAGEELSPEAVQVRRF